MNKKVTKTNKQYDSKEDLEIKKVAYSKKYTNIILLTILIVLFGFTFYCSLVYIYDYYLNPKKAPEIIEINNSKNNAVIANNGEFERAITSEDVKKRENVIIEKISTIDFKTSKKSEKDGKMYFDVKYDILENTFPNNPISTNDSEILVRFSYSFDEKEWTYINNVISYSGSNLSPLMGSYFDIAGLQNELSVVTNYELSSKPGESKTMYWKSETFIQSKEENIGKKVKANFKITYQKND